MAITQNDLEILKSEVMNDTDEGGGLPTGIAVIDGVSNNLFPDVSDIDRLLGRVRLRKVSLAVKTANAELLQATRMLFTELPDNPNISVFAFKATGFADRRSDAQDKIESYLAYGTKWAGHLLETQLAGQRVIQISLDKGDSIPSVDSPLVLVQNEGQSDEFYQYMRPLKVDTTERRFQKNATDTVIRTVATIEFGDTLQYTFNGLTVQEFYLNASTNRRAILREARVADAAKYYSASRLAEPVVAMQSRQVRLDSIFTQVVPSTQVETPLLQRDPANQVATQARGDGVIAINQSVTIANNTAFNLPSGIAAGTLSLSVNGFALTDRDGQVVNSSNVAYGSVNYGTGQITWYSNMATGQQSVVGSYKPASDFVRVAQTDYQIVGGNAGYNYVRELGAEPVPNSLKISYTVQGNNYVVHDDGRGNLIDDEGNGRGTVQGKTVLLTTAAIPDAESYIVYSFGVDLNTVKYGAQALPAAYHGATIDDNVVGDMTITWDNKTANVNEGLVTGDASGTFDGTYLSIAPSETVAKGMVFTVTYNKLLESMVTPISADYTLDNSNGIFETSIDLANTITGVGLSVALYDSSGKQLSLILNNNGAGKLIITGAYYFTGIKEYPHSATENAFGEGWSATLVSESLDKDAGKIDFKVKVSRKKSVVDVVMVGSGLNQKPTFNTKNIDEFLHIKRVVVGGTAKVGGTTASATHTTTASTLLIETPNVAKAPVVSGSLFIDALGQNLNDANSKIKNGATDVGTIQLESGVIELNTWQAGVTNAINLKSMLRENDPVPLANLVFRTPVSPLKEASLQISAELADGTVLSLSTGEQGGITGHPFAHGQVDFKAGFVALYFYEKLGVTDNPNAVNESWYNADNIYTESATGNTQFINRPIYVKPDSIRYNAIAYSYLPLDSELIGLDPVRLPTDGRVPFVRKGDSIAITELKTMTLPSNNPNDIFDLGFERLSDVNVVDANGNKVSFEYLNIDLDAGTLQLNGMLDMSFYTAPLTAKYRIMDIALVIETDISGRVTLSTPITHDYSTEAVFSSMLLAGDMQALAFNVFSQKSWSGKFSDTLIGDAATSQLQVTNNPIVVTNRDAIEERWALVFTSNTAFRIIGETIGEIGAGDINTLTAPINPMTGYAYFTIPQSAWGIGWSANNVVRINTAAAKYPIWIGNAIQQHQGSSKDNYDFTIGYHANIDRERGE